MYVNDKIAKKIKEIHKKVGNVRGDSLLVVSSMSVCSGHIPLENTLIYSYVDYPYIWYLVVLLDFLAIRDRL